MKQRLRNKGMTMFYSFIAVAIVFSQFAKIYQLKGQLKGILLLAVFALIAGIIPYKLIRWPAYLLSLFWGLFTFFPLDQPSLISWPPAFYDRLLQVHQYFIEGRLGYLPVELALLFLLVLFIFLLELLIEYENTAFSYLILVGYLLVLAVFNESDFQLSVLTLLTLALLQATYHKKDRRLILVPLILLLAGGAYFFPSQKAEEKLTVATAAVREYINTKGFYHLLDQGMARSGFSENDELLGGPLLDDNQVVFEAIQAIPHYWRVESKDVYTGKGWKNSRPLQHFTEDLNLEPSDYEGKLKETEKIRLHFIQSAAYLPLPYGKIDTVRKNFILNNFTGRVNFPRDARAKKIVLSWQDLDYSLKDLAQVKNKRPTSPVDYLQLPETLPQRIRSLAEKITAQKDTQLNQVLAVQHYLKEGEFQYSKIDAVLPGEKQDYVDQFLFESKVGYCDNFSTAMVVMLRSIGIPARWAKGFAEGTTVSQQNETKYVVTNNDAHSWVEVYFDGFGWLPFEPTPSFEQPLQKKEEAAPSQPETSQFSSSSTAGKMNSSNGSTASESSTTSATATSAVPAAADPQFPKGVLALLLLLAAGLGWLVYRWGFYGLVLILTDYSADPLVKVYPLLLQKAGKYLSREPGQPLSVYAKEVERRYVVFQGQFSRLTAYYEAALYGKIQVDKATVKPLLKEIALKLNGLK